MDNPQQRDWRTAHHHGALENVIYVVRECCRCQYLFQTHSRSWASLPLRRFAGRLVAVRRGDGV